jgi:hypothetical protein
MKPRWALVLLGAWVMESFCTSVVATENFYTVDRLLAAPHAALSASAHTLGPAGRARSAALPLRRSAEDRFVE